MPRPVHLSTQGARGGRGAQSPSTARRHRCRRTCTQSDDHRSRDCDSHGRYAGARPGAVRSRTLPTFSSRHRSRSSCSSRRTREIVSPLSTRSSSMRSTRSFPASEERTWPVSRTARSTPRHQSRAVCSASVSRRHSGRSKKLHVFSVAPHPVARQRSRRTKKGDRANKQAAATTVEAELRDELASTNETVTYRAVTIVNAAEKKQLALRIEVPVEDMARLTTKTDAPDQAASRGTGEAVDLDVGASAAARADSRASLDAALREQPATGGTARSVVERARG